MSIRSVGKFGAVASVLMATVLASSALAALGDRAGVAGAVRGTVQMVSFQTPNAMREFVSPEESPMATCGRMPRTLRVNAVCA